MTAPRLSAAPPRIAPRAGFALAGVTILAAAWLGPLPRLAEGSFLAHMALHMAVVALAAPLLALALRARLPVWAAVAASLVEMAVIWVWHAPGPHSAARTTDLGLAAEQLSFLGAAFLVWLAALSAPALAGAAALFFTSMHMTLLGVAVALARSPICRVETAGGPLFGLDPLADQEAGGILMLALGGAIYAGAGLALAGRALKLEPQP